MTRLNRSVLWLVVVLLAAGMAACSGNGQVDGPVLTSPGPPLIGGGGDDADVKGVVVYDDESACLLLEFEAHRYPVVWPSGASWDADRRAVDLDGTLIEPGMLVEGAGGYYSRDQVEERAGPEVARAAEACLGSTGEIAFFNLGSDVAVVAPK